MKNDFKVLSFFNGFFVVFFIIFGCLLDVFGEETKNLQDFINGYKEYTLQFPSPITLNAKILVFNKDTTEPDQELKVTLKYDINNLYLSYTPLDLNKTFEVVCSQDYHKCATTSLGIDGENYHVSEYVNKENYPPAWSRLSFFSSMFGYFPSFETVAKDEGESLSLLELMTNLNDVMVDSNQLTGEYNGIKVTITFFDNSFVPRSVFLDRTTSSGDDECGKLLSYHYEVIKYDTHPKTGCVIPTEYVTSSTTSGGVLPISDQKKELLMRQGKEMPKFYMPSNVTRNECVIELWRETVLKKKDFEFHEKINNTALTTILDPPQIGDVRIDDKGDSNPNENMSRIAKDDHRFIRSSWFWFLLIGIAAALTVGAMRLYRVWWKD